MTISKDYCLEAFSKGRDKQKHFKEIHLTLSPEINCFIPSVRDGCLVWLGAPAIHTQISREVRFNICFILHTDITLCHFLHVIVLIIVEKYHSSNGVVTNQYHIAFVDPLVSFSVFAQKFNKTD